MSRESIDFGVYLTGHDKDTIDQMYNDWMNSPSQKNKGISDNLVVQDKSLIAQIEEVCDQLTILIKNEEFLNTDCSRQIASKLGDVRFTLQKKLNFHNSYLSMLKLINELRQLSYTVSLKTKGNTVLCGVLLGQYYKPRINIFAELYPNLLYWKKDKCYKIIHTEICPIMGVRITMINEQNERHGFPICTLENADIIPNAT